MTGEVRCRGILLIALFAAGAHGARPRFDARSALAHQPIVFEANAGQAGAGVRFLSRGNGLSILLTRNEVLLKLKGATRPVRMRLDGGTASEPEGIERLPSFSNYFLGNDPRRWRTNVPHYSRVRYAGVYPGIDLIYYGNAKNIEFDFQLAAGADVSRIRVAYDGVAGLSVDQNGDLILETPRGRLRQLRPKAFQGGKPVDVRYVLGAGKVGFAVGNYDSRQVLTIDPILAYSTFLGGTVADAATSIAVDSEGAPYFTGWSESLEYQTAGSPYNDEFAGGRDVVVTKLRPDGSSMIHSTYVGGTGFEEGVSIAVDSDGNCYVAGRTNSTDFPTSSAFQATPGGGDDGFVFKLSSSGSSLLYSSYIGGSDSDYATSLALDGLRSVYVTGATRSTDFPTAFPFQGANGGGRDAFLIKISPAGSQLFAATYLGGAGEDEGAGVAVDRNNSAIVSGRAVCAALPAGPRLGPGGGLDAFVVKFAPDARTTIYSTCMGGKGTDAASAIALDSAGNVYLTGFTLSADFPTASAYRGSYSGGDSLGDAFIAKLNSTGTSLVFSTYLGGAGDDIGQSIAIDSSANIYVSGVTRSADFPAANSPPPVTGIPTAFLARVAQSGGELLSTLFVAGVDATDHYGVALDSRDSVYIAGGATRAFVLPSSKKPPLFPYTNSVREAFAAKLAAVNLVITQDTAPAFALPGDEVAIPFRVANRSQEDADNVSIAASLPFGLTLTACAAIGAACATAANSFRVTVPLLAAGQSIEVVPTVRVSNGLPAGTALSFTAFARSDTFDSRPSDNRVTATLLVVTQAGACSYSATSSIGIGPVSGAAGTLSVATSPGCYWAASSSVDWIAVGQSANADSGAVSFTVGPNPADTARSGSISVAGQLVNILQQGAVTNQVFVDVPLTNAYFAYIGEISRYGITSGCSPMEYCPGDTTTRGQMSVFIVRALSGGDSFPYVAAPYFEDVASTHPYFRYIQKLRELGITSGCAATRYCPDQVVTRGEMAVFLVRARLGAAAGQSFPYPSAPFFTDVQRSHPYFPFVQKLRQLGVTTGCSPALYCLDSPTTRDQMATFLIRAFFTP